MDPQLVAVAAAAAQALVQAMTSDSWAWVRDRVAGLFGRAEEGQTARAAESLEQARADLASAGDASVAGRWQGRLELLLEQHPDLAVELKTLVTQILAQREAPTVAFDVRAGRDAYSAAGDQTINQTFGGTDVAPP